MSTFRTLCGILLIVLTASSCTESYECLCDIKVYDIDGNIINSYTNSSSSIATVNGAKKICEDEEDRYSDPPSQTVNCYLD